MYGIQGFAPRLYQQTILNTATRGNTLVCLPTGRGKTKIALLIALHRLNNFPRSKVIFLTPTKPLAAQIAEEFRESSTIPEVAMFTGEMKPDERERQFRIADVVVSTPQGMSNDIINKRVDLRDVSLLVFDECHRAIGDYDYVWIAQQYQKVGNYPRVVGLSASPGSDQTTIKQVCDNLFIEDIEVRTDSDPDLKPYVQETTVNYIMVDLPKELKEAQQYLKDCFRSKIDVLKELGLSKGGQVSKTQILQMQRELQGRLARGERSPELWQSMSLIAETMKVSHAQELLETQGVSAVSTYIEKLYRESETGKVKATKKLVVDLNFKSAAVKIRSLQDAGVLHPKLAKLREIVKKEIGQCEKILIFNHYRDSAVRLKQILDTIPGVRSALFVGQTKKRGTGLSQKEQIALLEDFKVGIYNVIIGTSVGEEGIDIPAVDLILFYEPVPSAIRTVQRRGRTGRMEKGRVIVLVTKGTRDEAYRWTAFHKENQMHRVLQEMKSKLSLGKQAPKIKTLGDYGKPALKMYADSREKGSGVIKLLVNEGVDVRMQNLDVGDFLVSERVAVERKEVRDFVDSILDKRLMHQVRMMQQSYERPILLIEGTEDIYSVRRVHPNAIRGMLAWIAVDMKVPILYSKDSRDTAAILLTLAKREQGEGNKDFGIRGERKPLTQTQLQEYITAGLPGVGPLLARGLLKEFGSVKGVMNAKEVELEDVEKIGKKKAKEIRDILDAPYSGQ